METDFSRRVQRHRRLVFALLAVVVSQFALSVAMAADPALRHNAPAGLVSVALAVALVAGSVVLLMGTRAWREALR